MINDQEPLTTSESTILDIAQKDKYLSRLRSDSLSRLMAAGTLKTFQGNAVLVEDGSAMEEVYLILRGTASVSLYGGIDPAFWLYVSGRGTLVDLCALLDLSESPVTVKALSDLEVLAIPRGEFEKAMLEEPQVGYAMLQEICTRLSTINQVALGEYSRQKPFPSLN